MLLLGIFRSSISENDILLTAWCRGRSNTAWSPGRSVVGRALSSSPSIRCVLPLILLADRAGLWAPVQASVTCGPMEVINHEAHRTRRELVLVPVIYDDFKFFDAQDRVHLLPDGQRRGIHFDGTVGFPQRAHSAIVIGPVPDLPPRGPRGHVSSTFRSSFLRRGPVPPDRRPGRSSRRSQGHHAPDVPPSSTPPPPRAGAVRRPSVPPLARTALTWLTARVTSADLSCPVTSSPSSRLSGSPSASRSRSL